MLVSGKTPGGSLMFSESAYLKIKETDSFLIRLSLAFILHRSFGFLCLESELIIMKLMLTHSRLLEEQHLYWNADCLTAGSLSESLTRLRHRSPNASRPPVSFCSFYFCRCCCSSAQWCSLAVRHISDRRERSAGINGHTYKQPHAWNLFTYIMLRPSGIRAAEDHTPAQTPTALPGALMLGFTVSSEEPDEISIDIFIS